MSLSVLQLNTYGSSGGAGKAGLRLHLALGAAGCNSKIAVLRGAIPELGMDIVTPPPGVLKRAVRVIRRSALQRSFRANQLDTAATRWEMFSDCRSGMNQVSWRQLTEGYDIIHLHWVAGFVDYPSFFPQLGPKARLVWTIHDSAPFSGGCHYPKDCNRYENQCGQCPQLGPDRSSENDWTRKNHLIRQSALGHLAPNQLTVVSPSRWLADLSRRSSLLGRFRTLTISNCVDTSVYTATDKPLARRLLGLPPEGLCLFFIAHVLDCPRKGGATLLNALKTMKSGPVSLVMVGRNSAPLMQQLPSSVRGFNFGSVTNEHIMSLIYSAADFCVVPSLQDNLPNVILESMSCGTPVIGSRAGGIQELVEDSGAGHLFTPEDHAHLASILDDSAADPEGRAEQSTRARKYAIGAFDPAARAADHIKLYEEILAS